MASTLPANTQSQSLAQARLRELLYAQEECLSRYLLLLAKQREAIEQGAGETVLAYVELQKQTLATLCALEKVIIPLSPLGTDAALTARLSRLKRETAANSRQNQDLLAGRVNTLRAEIRQLREQPLWHRSMRGALNATPTYIDISL
jgi:hypothetical protein